MSLTRSTPPADGLDDYDRALIAALASGKSIAEAAVAAGLSVPTVYRRARRPWFKAALTEARASKFAPAMSAAMAALPRAVETFVAMMDDATAKNADRLSSAKAVVDVALRLGEQIDIRAELACVQAALHRLEHPAADAMPFDGPAGAAPDRFGGAADDR